MAGAFAGFWVMERSQPWNQEAHHYTLTTHLDTYTTRQDCNAHKAKCNTHYCRTGAHHKKVRIITSRAKCSNHTEFHAQISLQRGASSNRRCRTPGGMAADSQLARFSSLLRSDAQVDGVKLRRAAAAGVPPVVRGEVWRYLLGVVGTRRGDEMSLELKRTREYTRRAAAVDEDGAGSRSVRGVLKRCRGVWLPDGGGGRTDGGSKRGVVDGAVVAKFVRVVGAVMAGMDDDFDFHPDLVYLAAPFIELMPTEADAFFCFNALMRKHGSMFRADGMQTATSEFLLMFRAMHKDLHELFVAEEVDMSAWVPLWLRSLLTRQLPRPALLRLWDAYFATSSGDWLALHPYVCLSFIDIMKQELVDCDDAERIHSVLARLPSVDIDRIIAHARTAREDLRERDIL